MLIDYNKRLSVSYFIILQFDLDGIFIDKY